MDDKGFVIGLKGDDMPVVVRGVYELEHPDHLVGVCLQGKGKNGLRFVSGEPVVGRVEGEGHIAVEMVDVLEVQDLSRVGYIPRDGLVVDGNGEG